MGMCIADLKLVSTSADPVLGEAGKPSWKYIFCRGTAGQVKRDSTNTSSMSDLQHNGIPEGDLVVVSVEGEASFTGPNACKHNGQREENAYTSPDVGKHPCVTRGRILEKTASKISVVADRPLQTLLADQPDNVWRLDKDEFSSNFVRMRLNVLSKLPLTCINADN